MIENTAMPFMYVERFYDNALDINIGTSIPHGSFLLLLRLKTNCEM